MRLPFNVQLLSITLLACTNASCGGGASSESSAVSTGITYAPAYQSPPSREGAEMCVDCHRDLVDDWSATGMARTLQPVGENELAGLGSVVAGDSGFRYQYSTVENGSRPVLGETHLDHPEHAFGTEVLFAIGSGDMDRSYVVGHGAGLWFSPLEVLSTPRGRHAVLSPGEMMAPGSRLSMPITPECLGCHTDAPPPRSFPLNQRPAPASWQPRGISCAACHGESQAHAQWQEAYLAGDQVVGEDPLLASEQLDRVQQLSVCAACHLQGDARIVLNDQDLGPPAPGGDLLQQRALFVAREHGAEVGFVSQVERMVLSDCFLQSEMTCTTCHDPHRSLSMTEERARVRAACMKCHAGETSSHLRRALTSKATAAACSRDSMGTIETHSEQLNPAASQDCVSCHMPLAGVFDVAQVQIHDHFIRRDTRDARGPSSPDSLRFAESSEGDWRRFTWPGVAPPDHVDDPGLWMMAYASREHLERAVQLIDRTPGPLVDQLPMYHHVRGSLLEKVGRTDDARAAYTRALSLDPGLSPSAINLGLLLGSIGLLEQGLVLLDGVIKEHPLAASALRNRAILRNQAGNARGAIEDLMRAFSAHPDSSLALKLQEIFAGTGDLEAASRWRELAIELDPAAGQ
jgi:predicted CXXCH cytochrome family protein